jgi:hypothetical protein
MTGSGESGHAPFVILSEARNLSFFFMDVNRGEILRFAQNDKIN